jgi:MFS transporter, DHA1 family, chloramphenicol resistance protein
LTVSEPPSGARADAGGAPLAAHERLAIAALALAAFSLNLNTNVLGALLPFIREELALEPAHAKQLVAAAGFGSAAGALLFDRLARRWPARTVLIGGLQLFVASSLLHLVPGPFGWLLALRAIAAVAVGAAYAAASVLAAEVAPYARRGAAMGRFNAGMFLAIPVGMPLTVLLATAGSWQSIFAVQALVATVGAWWARRAIPVGGAVGERPPLLSVLRSKGAVAGLLATALHVGSFFTTVQLATIWLDDTGVVPRGRQMWLWVGVGLASVLGSAVLGRLADRVGKRVFVLATSVILVGCFLLLARGLDSTALLLVGVLLALCAAARTGPLQALLSGQVPASQLVALMSWRGFSMQLGVGAFALAAAPLADRLEFRGVLLLAAACQALSYLLIRFGCREGR